MEKQTVIKIIGSAIIFIFAVFFLQTISPQASAATDGLNWENPNKSGNNPYKFKPQDVLNSELAMQVVGCTGVVDKVSEALTDLFRKEVKEKEEQLERRAIIKACTGVKEGTLLSSLGIEGLTTALEYNINCDEIQQVQDKEAWEELIKKYKQDTATKRTEECFNGIAVTLARNQLTAMTRYTMNWVNTGFNGDPMYVQNITSFTNKLERNVIETGVKILISPNNAYPYGNAFAESALRGYSSGRIGTSFGNGANNFLYSLTSDLSNFITDPRSYYSERNLDKANGANDAFANDFSTGGWDGWLALTQKDQNNPLGFAMQTSQYLADQQANQLAGVKEELLTNNGFLSQKRCVLWELYDDDGEGIDNTNYSGLPGDSPYETSPTKQNKNDVCVEYEVVTPGSLIKDKVSYYINSPERQLELADTINESLNALFSALIAKFQDQGLSSLSAERYLYTDKDNMGLGYGDNSTMFGDDNLGSGYTDSFNLTRDLGNTYIYNYTQRSLGSWNAKNNIPELHIGVSPFDNEGKPLTNVYYDVSVAGNTKLIKEGYNGWAVGDRAFWNGKEWQNWKCGADRRTGRCANQKNPIKDRGVVQIQSDYVVAAKELLSNLPSIMPKIGELDYCIPGPNPNWRVNSDDAYSNFSDYAYSLNSEYKDGKFLKRDSTKISIAQPGDKEYDNYKELFNNTDSNLWTEITKTPDWFMLNFFVGTSKNNRIEDALQAVIDSILTNIGSKLQKFNEEYKISIDNLYGEDSLMQKPYLEKESTSTLLPNSSYLPMAETGLNITKDIVFYDEDIATMTQAYKDSIIQANSNIYKLNKIKDDVSRIIKAAQKRRDDNMRRILNEEATRNGTPVLTEAQYKIKYQNCLDEEDITFYDDTDIMSGTGGEEGRCDDDLDNDLDGLIDERDILDCSGVTIPVVPVIRR